MTKQICSGCGKSWKEYGMQWKRTNSNRIDYRCGNCGCKRTPIKSKESVVDIEKEDNDFLDNKIFDQAKKILKQITEPTPHKFQKTIDDNFWNLSDCDLDEYVEYTEELTPNPYYNKIKDRRVLVLADTHEPFCLDGYREFCYDLYKKYDCNYVIHLGDVIDQNFSSYHEIDPDGYGGNDELNLARKRVQEWAKMFPNVNVTTGNHCRIIMRKAKTGGIPSAWIKHFNDVLDINWRWEPSYFIDNVLYRHGVNSIGSTTELSEGCSIVQGHAHSVSRIIDKVGHGGAFFGFQVGCGIDHKSYAMLYSEKKPVIGAGVILENGRLPIRELMEL